MGQLEEFAAKSAEKALRYNNGKRKWGLVHYESLVPMVKVLEFGAKKYAPNNWMKPLDRTELLESAMRHLTALMDGQEKDPETGESHIGHLMCNAMFYSYHFVIKSPESETPPTEREKIIVSN